MQCVCGSTQSIRVRGTFSPHNIQPGSLIQTLSSGINWTEDTGLIITICIPCGRIQSQWPIRHNIYESPESSERDEVTNRDDAGSDDDMPELVPSRVRFEEDTFDDMPPLDTGSDDDMPELEEIPPQFYNAHSQIEKNEATIPLSVTISPLNHLKHVDSTDDKTVPIPQVVVKTDLVTSIHNWYNLTPDEIIDLYPSIMRTHDLPMASVNEIQTESLENLTLNPVLRYDRDQPFTKLKYNKGLGAIPDEIDGPDHPLYDDVWTYIDQTPSQYIHAPVSAVDDVD